MDKIEENYNFKINYINPGKHSPEAERTRRPNKEKIRAIFHILLSKCLPRLTIKILVANSDKILNFFPSKCGTSKYYV
jgi:hypothetical protein